MAARTHGGGGAVLNQYWFIYLPETGEEYWATVVQINGPVHLPQPEPAAAVRGYAETTAQVGYIPAEVKEDK